MTHSDNFTAQLHRLRSDRTSGAAQLARIALQIVLDELQEQPDPRTVYTALLEHVQRVRPSMAAIIGLTEQWRERCFALDSNLCDESWLQHAQRVAQELITRSEEAPAMIASHVQKQLRGNEVILTHSYSSTILAILARCRKLPLKIICCEARPLNEGVTMAKALRDLGFSVTVITEAQAAIALQEADLFLCGADTVFADGSIINKVGTWPIACAANFLAKPVWVASESFKKLPARFPSPTLEEMAAEELGYGNLAGICIKNVYFDRTPASLITQWFNESGTQKCAGEEL